MFLRASVDGVLELRGCCAPVVTVLTDTSALRAFFVFVFVCFFVAVHRENPAVPSLSLSLSLSLSVSLSLC